MNETLPATTATETNNLPAPLNTRLANLRHRAAQSTAEIWQPAEGETLCGIIRGHEKEVGVYGEGVVLLVEDEQGAITKAWLTPWIRDNLRAQGAQIGDLIALTFLGKRTSPARRTYNAYSLVIDKG